MEEYEHLLHAGKMDAITFDRLMKEFGQDVWSYAYFLTRDYHFANDISQEVFLRVYRSFASFRGESSMRTWLLKITRNLSLNYRRTAFFRRVRVQAEVEPGIRSRSAEEEFIEQEIRDELWKVILGLPAGFREVLLLEIRYGFTMKEIAKLTGVSEGTVKSRLSRARRKVSAAVQSAEQKEGERA
ncbi:RNA polymerase sigma factor [Gorillibacterium sp. sgz500922]|uniref:RNA polymerase sigma factor n=1 Tax=Gorillibacterium sp. sgz500922 TaxID=3446694 RepID=UPI003F66D85C